MEGIAVGFVFIIYGIIASISACGTALLISTLMLLVSRWWPPLVQALSWQTVLVTFLISLILIFRALVACNLVLCLL
jgi:hypothetical protein